MGLLDTSVVKVPYVSAAQRRPARRREVLQFNRLIVGLVEENGGLAALSSREMLTSPA